MAAATPSLRSAAPSEVPPPPPPPLPRSTLVILLLGGETGWPAPPPRRGACPCRRSCCAWKRSGFGFGFGFGALRLLSLLEVLLLPPGGKAYCCSSRLLLASDAVAPSDVAELLLPRAELHAEACRDVDGVNKVRAVSQEKV